MWSSRRVRVTTILTVVLLGEDALHGVVSEVTGRHNLVLMALGAQVVVVAHEALVATPFEVSTHTSIAANTLL